MVHITKRGLFGLLKRTPKVKFTVYPEGEKKKKIKVEANIGDNLLDTLNEQDIKELAIFGVCDKQLACHSCRVNFIKKYEVLPKPSEDEDDVLDELGNLYKENQTRMSCQLKVSKEMENCLIEIPRNAFVFFEKFNGDK